MIDETFFSGWHLERLNIMFCCLRVRIVNEEDCNHPGCRDIDRICGHISNCHNHTIRLLWNERRIISVIRRKKIRVIILVQHVKYSVHRYYRVLRHGTGLMIDVDSFMICNKKILPTSVHVALRINRFTVDF